MAKTEHVFLQGKGKWVKPYLPSDFGKWSLDLYMDKDNVEKFKAMKVKNHLKKDEDGYYVSLHRPTEIVRQGQKRGLNPPQVIDKDGQPMYNVAIGNGSDLTVDLEHYSYSHTGQKQYACRLSRIRVDNLVPYDAKKDLMPEELKADEEMSKVAIDF